MFAGKGVAPLYYGGATPFSALSSGRTEYQMPVSHGDLREQYRDSRHFDARVNLHVRFGTNQQPWMAWVFDHFRFPPAARILEIGCGPGALWRENAGRVSPGWRITLSDFSPGMVEQARHNLKGVDGTFDFKVFDATAIPFGADEFDAIIANHMLYHVPVLPATLAEIRRVLKPGGLLYAATNGQGHMRELDDLAPGFMPHAPTREVIGQFTLDNGGAALEAYVGPAMLDRFDSALVVTEAEPLVAYILSRASIIMPIDTISDEQRTAFTRRIAARMSEQGGAIRISKETGLFITTKA